MRPFALYLHIPYCDSKCPYCDFNSYAVQRWPEQLYVEALCRELITYAAAPEWSGRPVATVFLGGGTPSLFAPASIAHILNTARANFPFVAGPELTMECNPGTVDDAKLAGFLDAGVRRFSFGVQSFHEHHLRTLGRIHDAAQAVAALQAARRVGCDNLSLDLIYALPQQTTAEWRADLERACELGTEHVSAYNLTFEEGTPFHAWRRQGKLSGLDEDTEIEMFEAATEVLAAAGLQRYEISNYARPGFASRHNLNYWRSGDYLGLGAGAHGFCRGAGPEFGQRWNNRKSPQLYMAQVEAVGHARQHVEQLDRQQACGEFVFLNLRCTDGFAAADFSERFGTAFECEFPHATELVEDGLVQCVDGRWCLTQRGLLVADSVFAGFL